MQQRVSMDLRNWEHVALQGTYWRAVMLRGGSHYIASQNNALELPS